MNSDNLRDDIKIYLITDRKLFNNVCQFYNAVEDALRGGVKAVQLREKDLSIKELFEMANIMKELVKEYNARLFINDRVDVALAVEANGVHLGGNSMPIEAVRKISGRKLLIGKSTHSVEEALEADAAGADFITLGPVYETPSKLKYGRPIGIHTIHVVKEKLSIPVLAIGGIKLSNVREVKEAGADGIALITGILSAKDVVKTTKKFMEIIR